MSGTSEVPGLARRPDVLEGAVAWVDLGRTRGHEQSGHRPAVVVSAPDHLATATDLVAVVPVTTTDRAWPNHVRLTGPHGLAQPSWAMAEQVRTIDRTRVTGISGAVDEPTLATVRRFLRYHLDR